ncbi:MAG: hypothetical protein BYD32DRAFT_460774 [Podila humilis]|nr:MAG: hypothetical protein BYD32DRAFT_460774 [Podila humilis]
MSLADCNLLCMTNQNKYNHTETFALLDNETYHARDNGLLPNPTFHGIRINLGNSTGMIWTPLSVGVIYNETIVTTTSGLFPLSTTSDSSKSSTSSRDNI